MSSVQSASTRGRVVRFDEAFDGPTWPGPLGTADSAVFGVDWLGPHGLLGLLETNHGLGGLHPSATERVFDLCRRLKGKQGYWRASFEADPLATSRRLLADRDALFMAGWRGERVSTRLDELWTATSEALPGTVDRLRAVGDALGRRPADIDSITISAPRTQLPPLWRRLFVALETSGIAITHKPLVAAQAEGDLLAARSAGFTPNGDGSLVLRRPHGVLAAAEEVAATLTALDRLDQVVIVGGDTTLDQALQRHGLPRLGAQQAPPASTTLARLVLEASFEPMDPADLHGLLSIDPGPVPRVIARRLIGALAGLPSRRAPGWSKALEKALEWIDADRSAGVEARIDALLMPVAKRGDRLPLHLMKNRVTALARWARGRVEQAPSLSAVLQTAHNVVTLAELMGADSLSHADLRRLCDEAEVGAWRGTAEAGLANVINPGAVHGPADVIVWWQFTRASARSAPRLRLSRAERSRLAEIGIEPPDPASIMAAEAQRWRRPLLQARRALILVTPEHDSAGDRAFPHPLWDELCSHMPNQRLAPRLEMERVRLPSPPPRVIASLRPLPVPQTHIDVPGPLLLRERESPSSVESLLGCSLAWALRYHARIGGGASGGPAAPTPLLYGSLAHVLIAEVLAAGPVTPDAAAARAAQLVETHLPDLCEVLELPRYQGERATLKQAVVASARELAGLIAELDATVAGTEEAVQREWADVALKGRVDLRLADPDVVIDLKWGRSTNWKRLSSDSALQLAAYAALCQTPKGSPSVAYFILRDQSLIAEPGTSLPGAQVPGTASARDIWDGALVALREQKERLAQGELFAPGALGEDRQSVLAGDILRMGPPCTYCDKAALCGRGVGQ